MAITGPKVQFSVTEGIAPEVASLLHSLQIIAFNSTRSGSTASRPTDSLPGRWIGESFFDTTLNKPIWLKSVNPDVWIDATGAVV